MNHPHTSSPSIRHLNQSITTIGPRHNKSMMNSEMIAVLQDKVLSRVTKSKRKKLEQGTILEMRTYFVQ